MLACPCTRDVLLGAVGPRYRRGAGRRYRRLDQRAGVDWIKRADRSRRPLCCFADAEVLKGRWASALLGSYTVGHDTGDNFMLV